ncbi:MAG: fused MFS/spermidine synthase, partial [Planctomycetota bacterium]|nr:fused MFS/spermidine synthase [Planctomycetota bacterium]
MAKHNTAESAPAGVGAPSLYLVVFLSGAALMGLEMAGARLVEPHFGSTIYVWGSIIGVFMLALSLGYWGGGRFSDRSPRIETLGVILLAAAVISSLGTNNTGETTEKDLTEVLYLAKDDQLEEIVVRGNELIVTPKESAELPKITSRKDPAS